MQRTRLISKKYSTKNSKIRYYCQKYSQTTAESCLAVAALQLVRLDKGITITKKLEHDCLFSALRETRDDWIIGHLRFLSRMFGVHWSRMVQVPAYTRWLKRFDGEKITTTAMRITQKIISKKLEEGPLAVLIDDLPLFKIVHYPHWIVVLEQRNAKFKIFEPWEGKERWISAKLLEKGIVLLWKQLRFSPQMIQLQQHNSISVKRSSV